MPSKFERKETYSELVTLFVKDVCQNCKKNCDYVEFKREIVKEEPLTSIGEGYQRSSKYFDMYGGEGFGAKAFVDYLMDANETMYDLALKDASKYYRQRNGYYAITDRHTSMIVIHLRFLNPEIHEITLRYTVGDMIGNFGGQFGLFEQITGATFLGLVNLVLLLFKLLFSLRN